MAVNWTSVAAADLMRHAPSHPADVERQRLVAGHSFDSASPMAPTAARLHSYMSMLKALRGEPMSGGTYQRFSPIRGSAARDGGRSSSSHHHTTTGHTSFGYGTNDSAAVRGRGVPLTSPAPSAPPLARSHTPLASTRSGGNPSSLGLLAEKLRAEADETGRQLLRPLGGPGAHHTTAPAAATSQYTDDAYVALHARLTGRASDLAPGQPPTSCTTADRSAVGVSAPRPFMSAASGLDRTHDATVSNQLVATQSFLRPSSAASTARVDPFAASTAPAVLLARVTLPFLRKGSDPADAPSFVVQVADFEQSGDELLAYLVQQARIRFPAAWQASGRSGAFATPSHATYGCVLYCAGPSDMDVPMPTVASPAIPSASPLAPTVDPQMTGALLHCDGARLKDYRVVAHAIHAATTGTLTATLKRTLLASRALQPSSAASGPNNAVTSASAELSGHLFDLELFIFERQSVPSGDLAHVTLRDALL
jgi:hypothetical protein